MKDPGRRRGPVMRFGKIKSRIWRRRHQGGGEVPSPNSIWVREEEKTPIEKLY